MRVLYHHRIRSKDGQYVHLAEMVRAMRELGHEVLLVGPRQIESRAFGAGAGLVGALKRALPRAVYELLELGYSLMDYLRLRRAIARFRPDAIYERYNLYTPSGIWAKRRRRLPLLLEVNAPLYEERREHDGLALDKLARWSQRYVWGGADCVAPVTAVLADYVTREGVPAERVVVIPNAIDTQHFVAAPDNTAAKHRLQLDGRLVLGFTGFVRPWHGLERVLEFIAQRSRRDLVLLLVGDGPARPMLEARARALGISERLRITGIVDRRDIPRHVAAFDIALQPDVVEYASPLKIYEYLAMGRAIVAPDSANIREILAHECNALLFEPGDDAALRGALLRLCDDVELRRRLAAAARATIVERRISWEQNARRAIELLQAQRTAMDRQAGPRGERMTSLDRAPP